MIASVSSLGSGPQATLRIQVPREDQCEAVRQFLIDLDRLVPERLHVGECARVVKEEDGQ